MFYGEFDNKGDVCNAFGINDFEGVVLFAAYDLDGYDGYAEVIFVNNGKLYMASGSHCSCYGLSEGGWGPIEMPIGGLRRIIDQGRGLLHRHAQGLLPVLERIDDLNLDGLSPDRVALVLKLAIE